VLGPRLIIIEPNERATRTARDLLGESIVKLVITNGVDVANVTHLGRGPTAAQRIALL
jgi:BarA-like signal transduction histidine kinase